MINFLEWIDTKTIAWDNFSFRLLFRVPPEWKQNENIKKIFEFTEFDSSKSIECNVNDQNN